MFNNSTPHWGKGEERHPVPLRGTKEKNMKQIVKFNDEFCDVMPEEKEEKNPILEESDSLDFDVADIFRDPDPVIENVKKHYAECWIPKNVFDLFHHYLFYMPKDKEHSLSENQTYTIVAKFDNGKYMEIILHGVQYSDDKRYTNTAWTEAVLFDENGSEISRAEPDKHLDGVWSLDDANDIYTAIIHVFDDKE